MDTPDPGGAGGPGACWSPTSPGRGEADANCTYTFTLRPGVRYAPPVNREVTARDFITAIQRLYDKQTPSYAQPYADVIAGAKPFGAGRAKRISGLAAPTPTPSRSPWSSRPATSCPSSPCRCSLPCPGSTRPTTRWGSTRRARGRLRPLQPDHLHPGKAHRPGPQPQLGPGHRPPAPRLGRPHPDQVRG